MKNLFLVLACASLLVLSLSSCGDSKPERPRTKPVTDGVKETLDYGGTVGRAYNQSKDRIQNLNEEHNRQLEQFLEE